MSKRKLWDKLLILSHKAVFLILYLRSHSVIYILYSVTKKKREGGKKEKRHSLSKSGPAYNLSLFPTFLSELSLPLSSLTFPLSSKKTNSPPSTTPCPEAIWWSITSTILCSCFAKRRSHTSSVKCSASCDLLPTPCHFISFALY